GAGRAARKPAVVPARYLDDHERVFGRRERDDAVGLAVSEVDVVRPREQRRLAAVGTVARAAAVVARDVVPEIQLERLHVRGCGRRAVITQVPGRSAAGILDGRRAAAAAA